MSAVQGGRDAGRRRQRQLRRECVAAGDAAHVAHGTWAAYVTDKCRCAQCRALKSSYMKDYPGQAAVGVRPEPQQRL